MKSLLVFVPLFAISMAQRPTYAGSRPIGRPELASRFRDPNETSTAVPVANRLGEDGTAPRIPVDARGDTELVDRLNQWPREHRPFWLLNAGHIEASRNPQANPPTDGVQQVNDGQVNNIQARGSFGDNQTFFAGETRPIRPNQPRSSFLGALP